MILNVRPLFPLKEDGEYTIVPGGYEFIVDEKKVYFDFEHSSFDIKDDGTIEFLCEDFDNYNDDIPDEIINDGKHVEYLMQATKIDDIYIDFYDNKSGKEMIVPFIVNCIEFNDRGSIVSISNDLLQEFNVRNVQWSTNYFKAGRVIRCLDDSIYSVCDLTDEIWSTIDIENQLPVTDINSVDRRKCIILKDMVKESI